jgi:hypothetical protein
MSSQLHASDTLTQGKIPLLLMSKRVGGSTAGLGALEKMGSFCPCLTPRMYFPWCSHRYVIRPVVYSLVSEIGRDRQKGQHGREWKLQLHRRQRKEENTNM